MQEHDNPCLHELVRAKRVLIMNAGIIIVLTNLEHCKVIKTI